MSARVATEMPPVVCLRDRYIAALSVLLPDATDEECETAISSVSGFPFRIPGPEIRRRARVTCLLLFEDGHSRSEAIKAITRQYWNGAASTVQPLIANDDAGGHVNQPAQLRFDAMSDDQKARKLLICKHLID